MTRSRDGKGLCILNGIVRVVYKGRTEVPGRTVYESRTRLRNIAPGSAA